jgi:hypothetical protein
MDELATSGIDPGFDAIHIDSQPSDMCFINNNVLLNIQGESYFNPANVYPLQIKTSLEGNIDIALDSTEHFDPEQDIYIYDSVTQTYHDLKSGVFTVSLPVGTLNDRFSLRFMQSTLGTDDHELNHQIKVAYTQADRTLNIRNNTSDVTATSVLLYNMIGQRLATFDVENQDQMNIMIPVNNYSAGTYIVQIKTTNGDLSEKIILQ